MLGLLHRFAKSGRPARRTGHPAGFRPEVEGLGGSTHGSGGRRLPVRPEVEPLEERRLMSSSGVISAVTDNSGSTTVFALGSDHSVYKFFAAQDLWFPRNPPSVWCSQISAGLNGSGHPVCYTIDAWTHHVWALDDDGGARDLGYTATQISATRNNECFALHTNYPSDWVGIYNGATGSWSSWNGPWGTLAQLTTGVDGSGRDEVYLLNTARQVYRMDSGWCWALPFQATQISAGAASRNPADFDLFYIDTTANHNAYHYDGSSSRLMANYVAQISAGTDQYGNEVLYSIDMYMRWLRRTDMSGHAEWEYGNVSQISAAGNDMVFAVNSSDNSVSVFDRGWSWYGLWYSTNNWGSGGWHTLYGGWSGAPTAANPAYFPLAA